MFVYVIVNDVNLKIYIGKTTRPGLGHYFQQKCFEAKKKLSLRSHLYAAIRKYGREHFHIFPLYEGSTNEEIFEHEKLLIKALGSQHPDIGYNICRGGEGFTGPHSDESRKKIGSASKGHPNYTTPEGVAKMAASKRGVKLTEKHRTAISKRLKGIPKTKEHIAHMNVHENNRRTAVCPYCSRQGQYINMKRWHFENCNNYGKP